MPTAPSLYETVYARHAGAVAAPTAGLHFTPALLEKLAKRGIDSAFLTLHVGPGTFLPVKVDDPAGTPCTRKSISCRPKRRRR